MREKIVCSRKILENLFIFARRTGGLSALRPDRNGCVCADSNIGWWRFRPLISSCRAVMQMWPSGRDVTKCIV